MAAGAEAALAAPNAKPPTIRIARIAMRATTPHPNGDLVRNLLFSTDVFMWFFVTIRATASALFIDIGFPIIGKTIRLKPHLTMLTLGKLHVAFPLDDAKKAGTTDADLIDAFELPQERHRDNERNRGGDERMVEALAGVDLPTDERPDRGGTREEDRGRKVRADRQGERADGVVVRSPVDKAADRRGDAQRDHFLRLILRGAE